MDQLDDLLIKTGFKKRTESCQIAIAEIEAHIMAALPDDYKAFLRCYTAFEDFIGPEYVNLLAAEDVVERNNDYGITEYLPGTLMIGGNMGGEFIALDMADGQYRVVLSPLIDLDRLYHMEIGNSFTDFLLRLLNGRQWFEDV